jgi:hypothetical protein
MLVSLTRIPTKISNPSEARSQELSDQNVRFPIFKITQFLHIVPLVQPTESVKLLPTTLLQNTLKPCATTVSSRIRLNPFFTVCCPDFFAFVAA